MTNIFCKHHKSQFCAIYFEFFLFFVLSVFLSKTSTGFLCLLISATFLLTPFPFRIYPPSTTMKEYIFDFNPTASLIFLPFDFIFPFTDHLFFEKIKKLHLLDNH